MSATSNARFGPQDAPAPSLPNTGRTPCQVLGPDLWFPEAGDTHSAPRAKVLCRDKCPRPAFDACLTYALHHGVVGIWGGTDPRERAEIRRRQGITPRPVGMSTNWERVEQVVRMHERGTPVDSIARVTEMSADSVRQILKRRGAA